MILNNLIPNPDLISSLKENLLQLIPNKPGKLETEFFNSTFHSLYSISKPSCEAKEKRVISPTNTPELCLKSPKIEQYSYYKLNKNPFFIPKKNP